MRAKTKLYSLFFLLFIGYGFCAEFPTPANSPSQGPSDTSRCSYCDRKLLFVGGIEEPKICDVCTSYVASSPYLDKEKVKAMIRQGKVFFRDTWRCPYCECDIEHSPVTRAIKDWGRTCNACGLYIRKYKDKYPKDKLLDLLDERRLERKIQSDNYLAKNHGITLVNPGFGVPTINMTLYPPNIYCPTPFYPQYPYQQGYPQPVHAPILHVDGDGSEQQGCTILPNCYYEIASLYESDSDEEMDTDDYTDSDTEIAPEENGPTAIDKMSVTSLVN